MIVPANREPLAPYLEDTFQMVQAAFPDGILDSAYHPLLVLLYEGMSYRTLARLMEHCTEKVYPSTYHDVMAAVSRHEAGDLDPAALEEVKRLLVEHGYNEWLTRE